MFEFPLLAKRPLNIWFKFLNNFLWRVLRETKFKDNFCELNEIEVVDWIIN